MSLFIFTDIEKMKINRWNTINEPTFFGMASHELNYYIGSKVHSSYSLLQIL